MQMNREPSVREKNIVLIGFMGVGKTTIGKLIAQKLMRDFIDIDEEIEKKFGMPTPEIFKQFGEQKFREAEKDVIHHVCTQTRLKVVALGGGAFMQAANREVCLDTSIVFFLDLSFDSWKERLDLIIDNRPVLQDKSLEEMEQIFNTRQNVYAFNNSKINTDDFTPEQTADYIIDTLKLGWEIYTPNHRL